MSPELTEIRPVAEPASIIADLQNLLESAWAVQAVAEARAREAREELFGVAKALCSAAMDQQRQSAEWDAKSLAQLIIREVGRQVDELGWLRGNLKTGQTQAKQQSEELTQQNATLQKELQDCQGALTQAQEEIGRLKLMNQGYEVEVQRLTLQVRERDQRPAESINPPAGVAESSPVEERATFEEHSPAEAHSDKPDWLQEWSRTEMYGRDADLLHVIGSSLECRRDKILNLFVRRSHDRAPSGAENKVLARLIGMELVEAKPVKLYPGNSPNLLALLPRGLDAYRRLYTDPLQNAYEKYRAVHKSEDQIYLVLQTIDFFEQLGYQIERFPAALRLSDGSSFAPDLIATRGHERLCLEVETGSFSNGAERDRKWRVIAAGTGGQVYIVTHNRKSMSKLLGEVQNIRYPQPVSLYLTNLEEAAALPPESRIWREERQVN